MSCSFCQSTAHLTDDHCDANDERIYYSGERSWAKTVGADLYRTLIRDGHAAGCTCYLCRVLVLLGAVEDGIRTDEADAVLRSSTKVLPIRP